MKTEKLKEKFFKKLLEEAVLPKGEHVLTKDEDWEETLKNLNLAFAKLESLSFLNDPNYKIYPLNAWLLKIK